MDIRTATGIIIEKDGLFLVGCDIFGRLRWSSSPWDAWLTRHKDCALKVADRIGGKRYLFNPVAGQLKEMRDVA